MTIQTIQIDKSPAAIGPYSQAICTNGKLYTSGQQSLDPVSEKIVGGLIDQQASQTFKNLSAIAEAAGTSLGKTVKTTIFLKTLVIFKLSMKFMENLSEPFPPRIAFQVAALPLVARVKVETVITI